MAQAPETAKAYNRRVQESFFYKYIRGNGLDIGYQGGDLNAETLRSNATGIDLNYPNYNGTHLPFPDNSQDFVYSSHCLEHVNDYKTFIQENYRVTKVGGYIIICVPHQFLYEKKAYLPSHYNGGHVRFYTPALLMHEIETSLEPNTYRVRYLKDCDEGYDYSIPPESHAGGEYAIELVLQKIQKPIWEIK